MSLRGWAGVVTISVLTASCGLSNDEQPAPSQTEVARGSEPIDPAASAEWLREIQTRVANGEYRFQAREDGFYGSNRKHDLRVNFRNGEVEIATRGSVEDDKLTLRLATWGRHVALSEVERRAPLQGSCSSGTRLDEHGECLRRVELVHGDLIEWWENRSEGLEQGFTILQRPAGKGPLRLEIEIKGASASVEQAGASATIELSNGKRLSYRGLHAFDASGQTVVARLVEQRSGLRIEVEDAGAQYPLTVDPLVTSNGWAYESDHNDAQFGVACASAGDVNADGFSDLIVGAPFFDNLEQDEGRAFLFLGSSSGLAAAPAWTTESDQIGARLGTWVASAGDVNADGFSDVIIGTPYYDDGQTDEGRAQVFLGSASGLAGTAVWTVNGDQDGAHLGQSAASAGDVDGDGRSDVIVGAPLYDAGQTDEGRAMVYLGTSGGVAAAPVWTKESNQAFAEYGYSVAGAGDANGDGYAEVIVGAPKYDNGQTDEGYAYAYLGSAAGPAATQFWWDEGGSSGAKLGFSVAGSGDVNGDGYADVVVGVPETAESGYAYGYYGSATGLSFLRPWESGGTWSTYGWSVAGAGDVNGDGYADVLVGAVGNQRTWIHYGSPVGTISTSQTGPYVGGSGACLASAGDVNGDGLSDIVTGWPEYDNVQTNEGRVDVFYGSTSSISTTRSWGDSGSINSQLGWSLAGAGDVNGDGWDDLLVGSPNGTGSARLYLGSSSGPEGNSSWSVSGGQTAANLGRSVAGVGDVNGDGYADIAVGAPNWDENEPDPEEDPPDNIDSNEGRALLYLGSPTGPDSDYAWVVAGAEANALLGTSIAAAGDVNADGYADVAVGESEGVRVFLGSSVGLSPTPEWTATGAQVGELYGAALASAGDVNGDGYADLLVGAPSYDAGQNNEGRIYGYYGSASGLSLTASWNVESNLTNAAIGGAVASAGDVNGDGYSDVIVGNPSNSTLNSYVYHGSASGLATTAAWTQAVGGSVSSAGDVNADGYADVVVGNANSSGAVRVFLGRSVGLHTTAISLPQSLSQSGSQYGRTVANAGDVNGDGYSDVAVASPMTASGGRIHVYFGNTGDLTGRGVGLGLGARRAGSAIPIAPGAVVAASELDTFLATARAPFGRGRVKIEVEVKPAGTPFDGLGVVVGSSWTDSTVNGALVVNQITDLDPTESYRFRARMHYGPSNGWPQSRSRWLYGGRLEHRLGIHLRTECGTLDSDSDGTPNCADECPSDPGKTREGLCGCDADEHDEDFDGTPDCNDGCAFDPAKTDPGVCGCDIADINTDGDGAFDCQEDCDSDPNKTTAGVCGCGTADTNTDGDSALDCQEDCDSDPNKTTAGVCGCGTADTNTDGDSALDCQEDCDNDPNKTTAGVCGCGTADTNSDGDGALDCQEDCDADPNKTTAGVCGCGTADTNTDGDSALDCQEDCDNDPNKTIAGACGCGIADTNTDNDGAYDCQEDCDNDPNKTTAGVCGCGIADTNTDNDGAYDCQEDCDNDPNKMTAGVCGCGVADANTDGDGALDCQEACDNDPNKTTAGVCGCGLADTDSDSDGTANCNDGCDADPNKVAPGVCGCGAPEVVGCGLILDAGSGSGEPDASDAGDRDADADIDAGGTETPGDPDIDAAGTETPSHDQDASDPILDSGQAGAGQAGAGQAGAAGSSADGGEPGAEDAGSQGGATSTGDASAPGADQDIDSGSEVSPEGGATNQSGCGCRIPNGSQGNAGIWSIALLLAIAALRRRAARTP